MRSWGWEETPALGKFRVEEVRRARMLSWTEMYKRRPAWTFAC